MKDALLHFRLFELKNALIFDNYFLELCNWSHALDFKQTWIKYCALQIEPNVSLKTCAVERV